jgi:hypothetical protein
VGASRDWVEEEARAKSEHRALASRRVERIFFMTGWIPLKPSIPAYSHARDVGKKYRDKIPAVFPFFPVAPGRGLRTVYRMVEGLGIVAGFELA